MAPRRDIKWASVGELRKLSPRENVKAGHSPKSENYYWKNAARITKNSATLSKRQFLKKQEAERTGRPPISLEKAARERREGTRPYSSAASESQAAKTRITREIKRKLRELIVVRDGKGRPYNVSAKSDYMEWRKRKLKGEWLENREWFSMMDMANAINDPMLSELRSSTPMDGE